MSKSSKRPMKSYFNAKSAVVNRRQRNREYTTRQSEKTEYIPLLKPNELKGGIK